MFNYNMFNHAWKINSLDKKFYKFITTWWSCRTLLSNPYRSIFNPIIRVVTRYMRSGINGLGVGSGITAPGSGITTLGIGISSVLVESGIKIVNVFGIRDQNSQCFCDQGLKFSTFLWSGIKIWGKNTGSVMKKNTLLRPCYYRLPLTKWIKGGTVGVWVDWVWNS